MSDRDLGRFARRYFTMIGAALALDLPDYLEVDLPPGWRRWFDGRPRLAVALTREALADHPQAQLLTYGAPLLEQIAGSLEAHGDLMVSDFGDGGGPVLWPHVEHAVATECGEPRHGTGWVASVWYRVALTADEVQERIASVVVPVGEVPQALADRVVRDLLDGGARRGEDPPRTGGAPASGELLGRARAALAGALAGEITAFRSAKRAACEDEIARLRLHHDAQRQELERLTSDGARAQLAQLPEVMQRRIDEECEKYRVTVKAAPLAISLARVPLVHRRVRYASALREESVELDLTACPELAVPAEVACHACGGGCADAALCPGGHLVHRETCAAMCAGECRRGACRKCLASACARCGGALCAACTRSCALCGKPGCHLHAMRCAICEREVCDEHMGPCRFCRFATCTACRGLTVPVARGAPAGGEGECTACRHLTAGAAGEAGDRRVVAVRGWFGGHIEVRERTSGRLLLRRRVWPWVTWFDRRFR